MKGKGMKPNIVFALGYIAPLKGVSERICHGVLPEVIEERVVRSNWWRNARSKDILLWMHILHQRSSTQATSNRVRAISRNVVVKSPTSRICTISSSYSASLANACFDVVHLKGTNNSDSGMAFYQSSWSEAEVHELYLHLLTGIKAWSENGCFSSRDSISAKKVFSPEELPKWEEDPRYFIL